MTSNFNKKYWYIFCYPTHPQVGRKKATHKIYPGAGCQDGGGIKVFDAKECDGVKPADMEEFCTLRMSFVRGFGLDYKRKIEETPCWVEIRLHISQI